MSGKIWSLLVVVVVAFGSWADAQSLLPFSTVNPNYEFGSAPRTAAERLNQPIGPTSLPANRLPTVATAVPPQTIPTVPTRARSVIGFYGGQNATKTLQQLPRRPSFSGNSAALARPNKPASKPFSTVGQDPTVSPYLNLYLEERGDAAPNYFAFVRPQLQQREANRRQQADLQRLERQLQGVATASSANRSSTSAGLPATGHQTRYGDTGHFYSGLAQ